MANKKSKKKEPQKAAKAKSAATDSKVDAKKTVAKSKASKPAKKATPGFIARVTKPLKSIRSEMKRVTWPSRKELLNYSVVVCVSLVVVGVVIAVLDAIIGGGLVLLSGLRG